MRFRSPLLPFLFLFSFSFSSLSLHFFHIRACVMSRHFMSHKQYKGDHSFHMPSSISVPLSVTFSLLKVQSFPFSLLAPPQLCESSSNGASLTSEAALCGSRTVRPAAPEADCKPGPPHPFLFAFLFLLFLLIFFLIFKRKPYIVKLIHKYYFI